MRLLLTSLLFSILATLPYTAVTQQTPDPMVFDDWTIAFVRSGDIWISRADGTGKKLIIKNGGAPCWSPDKRKLVFYRQGNIWIAGSDGMGERQLTHYGKNHASDTNGIRISWNGRTNGIIFARPDRIVVKSTASGHKGEIGGSAIFDLHPVSAPKPKLSVRFDVSDSGAGFVFTDNDNPAWSPSGKALAFTRNGDIWIARYVPEEDGMRAGWDISRLAATAVYDSPTYRASRENKAVTSLSWSPDEKHLAYTLNRLGGSGTAELHIITLHANEKSQLVVSDDKMLLNESTPAPSGSAFQPRYASFSPDGNWIAFSSVDTVYAVSHDGKQILKLISNATQAVW